MRLDLYVITDSKLSLGRSDAEVVREAIAGGATIIQLRDKHAGGKHLVEVGRQLRAITREAGVLFVVNDRVDVALAVEADGVHVGQDDMPADLVRRLIGPGMILGVSAATVAEAERAKADGADYLGVGALFATATKDDAGTPTGLAVIGEIKRALGLPIVGIGGINHRNAADVIRAGADGVAVISAVVSAPDIRQSAAALAALVADTKTQRDG
ncbi:MAG: thiamine phosphate synthase [Chloroflexota bacterium]